MEQFYLTDYLLGSATPADADMLDSLKFELDRRIYHYGGQFAYPFEPVRRQNLLKAGIKSLLRRLPSFADTPEQESKNIICSAYFSVSEELEKAEFTVTPAPWLLSEKQLGKNLFRLTTEIQNTLSFGSLAELTDGNFLQKISQFRIEYEFFLRLGAFRGAVLAYDMPFFERETIKLCKKLSIPTAIFLHGLPGRYNPLDDNRTDYLFVWGERIRQNYITAGVNPAKIFVTGHPTLKLPANPPKQHDGDTLVIAKSMNGGQHSAGAILSDRGNCVLYLAMVRDALKNAGIKTARLRTHPSESISWYLAQLGADFYKPDISPLPKSLARAGKVIGPTSTVLIEALLAGTDYYLFDPNKNGLDMLNYPLVNPFDGSEPRLALYSTAQQLTEALVCNRKQGHEFLKDYISAPFNISIAKTLFK